MLSVFKEFLKTMESNSNKLSYDEFATNSSEDEGFKESESNVSIVIQEKVLNLSCSSPNLLEKAKLILEDHFSALMFASATEAVNSGRRTHFTRKDLERNNQLFKSKSVLAKISYNRDELMSFAGAKIPSNWSDISRRFPNIVNTVDLEKQQPVTSDPYNEKHFTANKNGYPKFQASDSPRITYKYEMLMFLARNRQSISKPKDWKNIVERFPRIVYKGLVQYQEVEVMARNPLTNEDYIEHRILGIH